MAAPVNSTADCSVTTSAGTPGAQQRAVGRALIGATRRAEMRSLRLLASMLGGLGLVALSASTAVAQDAQPAPAEGAAAAVEPAAPAPADTSGADAAAALGMEAPPLDDVADFGNAPAAGGEAPGRGVEEVVVTVDRRKKNLQKYSGVASAFTESKLANVGITNVRELSAVVPGLQIGTQEGNTEVYIRGVGSDNNTELGDPAVALHLDGIYIPRPRGIGSMFFDIERVEVSSGPQGTLRGRNAMGGTVNIVGKEPQIDEYGANAEATFGTFNQRRLQGMVNIPLGSKVAFRVAGFSEVRDSYWQNIGPNYDIVPAESANAYALRAALKYQPTSRFSAIAAFDYTREMGTPYLGANMFPAMTRLDDAGATIPFDVNGEDNPRRTFLRGRNPSSDLSHWGGRLALSYDLGPAIVDATGSFRRMHFEQTTGSNAGYVYDGFDFAGADADVFSDGFWDTSSDSVIGELRVYAPDSARLRWTAGLFYFDEVQDAFLGQVSDPANYFAGGEFNMPGVTGNSLAGFADATFDVSEKFRLIGGARVTKEEKTRNDGLWSLFNNFSAPRAGISDQDTTPDDIRFGTEGFKFEKFNRGQYTLPANYESLNDEQKLTERVNMFLAGVESFGARDTLPLYLCEGAGVDAEGNANPVIVPNERAGSGWQCANGVSQALLASNPGTLQFVPQNNDVSNLFFDWRAGAEYDLGADQLVYATVSTGHKAGGFNDTAPGATPDALFNSEYGVEQVLAFELGSKNMLLDRKLRLNASAFAYKYSDYVFQTIVSVGGDGPTQVDEDGNPLANNTAVRQNAANVNVYGLDLDLNYRLPAGLEAEVHALLMDAKFGEGDPVVDSRIGFGGSDNYEVDLKDKWLPRASRLTLNYALSQVIYSSVGSFNWNIQAQTRSKHYMSVYNGEGSVLPISPDAATPLPPTTNADGGLTPYGQLVSSPAAAQRLSDVVPTYTRFDIGAGWKHTDGRLSINGFVSNVTNIAYATSIIATPGLNLRFFNPPRQAGIRVRMDW